MEKEREEDKLKRQSTVDLRGMKKRGSVLDCRKFAKSKRIHPKGLVNLRNQEKVRAAKFAEDVLESPGPVEKIKTRPEIAINQEPQPPKVDQKDLEPMVEESKREESSPEDIYIKEESKLDILRNRGGMPLRVGQIWARFGARLARFGSAFKERVSGKHFAFDGFLSRQWGKSLAIFVVVAFLPVILVKGISFASERILNLKGDVLANANVAFQYMTSAGSSITDEDYDLAAYKFDVAVQRFVSTKRDLDILGSGMSDILGVLPGGTQLSDGDNLLEAGGNIAEAGEAASKSLAAFSNVPGVFELVAEDEKSGSLFPDYKETTFTDALVESTENLEVALEKIFAAEKNLNAVDESRLPDDIGPQIMVLKEQLPVVRQSLQGFLDYSNSILDILGHWELKRYLVIFQNNRELRATGGFIGTYALIDVNEGRIVNWLVEGPYHLDGSFPEVVTAPEPLRLIAPRFYMRDTNWFFDYPTSAKKIANYYEREGGPTVDGVISITGLVFEDLLKVLGPVEMEEYGETITAENFFEEAQQEVEFEYDKEVNRPKEFISDMMVKVLGQVKELEGAKKIEIFQALIRNLEQKQIMIYFTDPELQTNITDMNWGGEVKDSPKDYLAVVNTNIGGGKTDAAVEDDIYHQVEVQKDGSVLGTVVIKKVHHGTEDDFWNGTKSMTYVRVYVPMGSRLISAEGFDPEFWEVILAPPDEAKVDPEIAAMESNVWIDEETKTRVTREGDKIVFANWVGLEASKEKIIKLQYLLPFKILIAPENPAANYSLMVQKQSGTVGRDFYSQIIFPDTWKDVWRYGEEESFVNLERGKIGYRTVLDRDKAYALVFTKR